VNRRGRSRPGIALATCACVAAGLACESVTPRYQIGAVPAPRETLTVIAAPNAFSAASAQALLPNLVDAADSTEAAVSWSSNDTRIAVVNQSGMVVGRAPGTTVVTSTREGRWAVTAVQVVPSTDPRFRIIAHRGFMRRFPENTLVAVRGSFDQGADAVEIDIRLSADGVPIVMHDETVDRTTDGHGLVSALNANELATLNACVRWANTPPCAIPTMAEVLREAQGRGGLLLHLYGNYSTSDLENLLDMVRRAKMDRDAMFISFDYPVLTAIRQLDAVVGLGFLTNRLPAPQFIDALGRMAPVVELQASLGDSTAVRTYLVAAQGLQQEAGVWVAWNQTQAKQAAALGFRTIIADVPIDRNALLP